MERKSKKTSTLPITLFLVIVVCGSIFFVVQSLSTMVSRLDETEKQEIREAILPKNPLSSLKQTPEGYTNALLLGIGGPGHKSGELTDSIMLISLSHTKERPSFIFSIPRDLWVRGTDNEFTKINELYKQDGGTAEPDHKKTGRIKEKVEEITGQTIHYIAVVDLIAIEDLANFFDGITIDGVHYSGETLTAYLRDRSVPGNDFTRMNNQKKVLVALLEKIEQGNLLGSLEKATEAYAIIADHASINIGITDYFGVFELSKSVTSDNIELYSITPENNLLQPAQRMLYGYIQVYALIPTAGEENYRDIKSFVETILSNEQSASLPPSQPEIETPLSEPTT
ncbi:MAG: LytR family transcriptional regulator [Candidatus Spechtbacteria bacterium SB0662_bin_43]|uniref:LytR family transcriptional regulator n=1 Tax=Candidatus Spechtbacteria bacterium SB0662_bin_43 TaxID=2604897 RepID=A0A845D9W4_9BACT|nr:LytR family transcriptional regulator [Candidatus Spechtbacteria bacterium SB0662_bin_43]